MSEQHTPGPWYVDSAGDVCAGDCCVAIIVDVREGVNSADNARLIAAAPELLSELEAAAKMLRSLAEVAEDVRLEGAPMIRERLASVEAAIAKARGAS